ncbi:MAG: hypothetical protein ACXACR_14950, partial [Candidatus Hodarchaeales archaeon]
RLVVDQYIKGVFGKQVKIEFQNENSQAVWNEIVNAYDFDWLQFGKKIQRIEELSYMALVLPRYDPVRDQIYFNVYRGDDVFFFPSKTDPTNFEAVLIDYEYDSGYGATKNDDGVVRRIEIYTHYDILIFDIYSDDHVEEVFVSENPYVDTLSKNQTTIIPAVRFVAEEDDFSLYGNNSIYDFVKMNHAYNMLWMDFRQVLKFQTFSILMAKFSDINEMKIAPTRLFKTEDPQASLEYVTPYAAIAEFREAIELYKSEMLDLSSLPVDVLSGTNKAEAETGYSLKIKRMPIDQLWERRQDSNRASLIELMRKTMLFTEVHTKRKGLYDDKPITIDFGEIEVPMMVAEEQAKDEWEVRHAIASPYEIIQRRNPDLTKEQAKEQYETNLDDIQEARESRISRGLDVSVFEEKRLNEVQGERFSSMATTEKTGSE